jgi:hypothetical protein
MGIIIQMTTIEDALQQIADIRQSVEQQLDEDLANLKVQYAKLGYSLEYTKRKVEENGARPKAVNVGEPELSTADKRAILVSRGRPIGTRRWTREEQEAWDDLLRYGEATLAEGHVDAQDDEEFDDSDEEAAL